MRSNRIGQIQNDAPVGSTRPTSRNRTKRQRGQRGQRGMTLVEIMIVIAIIGMVMGAVVVGAFPAFKKAQCKTAWTETQSIAQAITAYQTDHDGDCPKGMDDLVSGKYLSKAPTDPWGKSIEYKCPGDKNTDGSDVWSSGPDKNSGSPDDVLGWESQNKCNDVGAKK